MPDRTAALEDLQDVGEAEAWAVLGTERVYASEWLSVDLVEVVPPGRRSGYRHHVARVPSTVGVIVRRADGKVLLLHRSRFITGTSGFEIPAGGIEGGESVEDAARREVLEETGLHLGTVRPTYTCSASDGVSDERFHILLGDVASDSGFVRDVHESSARVWVDRAELTELLRAGRVPGAMTSTALLHGLWSGDL